MNGGAVYLDNVSIWWKEDRECIGIRVGGENASISSVDADKESKRGNPNLFYKLARCLKAAGSPQPPIPDDG